MNDIFHTTPTAAASALALIIGFLIWTVGRQQWPRVTAFLFIGGAAGLVNTPLGRWVREAIAWLYGQVGDFAGQLVGVSAGTVAVVAAIGLGIMVGFHVHHRAIGDKTLIAAAAIPWAVLFVPGAVGSFLAWLVSVPAGVVGELGYLAFNGHL